ncbi:MAG: DUF3887 domain-containing protein [Acidobacteria bacterium]|nr:DUF3887 domain-containing protein [Acidobacteriota bacterium]MBV9070158.1 DUF3887 domain-containing protein [Acidobacteriota bacterium]MBV9185828.1 DUF3887 domain-containing protein [Acidobacteriota bacterium]
MKIIASLLLTALFAVGPRPRLQTPIETTARAFLSNFAAGRFLDATRDFNDDLRPVVTVAMLADLKREFDQRAGVFLSVAEVHERREEGARAIELIARYSKAPVSMVVVFDQMDHIASIHANPIGPEPALESAARALLANFVAGHFDDIEKAFDDTMRKQLPPSAMGQLAASVAETFGTYQGVNDVKQRASPPYRVIDITVAYTKRTAAFHVAFDLQNRVAALQIAPAPNQP